jgi:release factor glutamine methyltransferase
VDIALRKRSSSTCSCPDILTIVASVNDTLHAVTHRLERAGVPSPRADAEWLVLHVLNRSRSALLLEGARLLTTAELERLEELVRRREAREPLQWILGSVEFYDLELRVRPGVLIPRPETEVLIELIFQELSTELSTPPLRLVDIGCGSGAISLSVKHRYPQLEVWATDISPDAVNLTLENARHANLELHVRQTSLLDDVPGMFHAIVSNPPYLPETDSLEPEVALEPHAALFSGADGLQLAREIARLAVERLEPNGLLALELDPRNAPMLRDELEPLGFTARLEADLTGRSRFVIARKHP